MTGLGGRLSGGYGSGLRLVEVGGQTVGFGYLCGREPDEQRYISANRSGFDLMAAQDGQRFAQPDWTINTGVRYDLPISADINSYARLDYTWFENYQTAPLGSPNYTPDSSEVPSQRQLNLRIGVDVGSFDVNFFVYNLTDEDEGALGGGRSACTNAECSTFNNYNMARTINSPMPRQIGLQLAYRY